MECKYCGCTDGKACVGGCSWIEDEVCSNCIMKIETIKNELKVYSEDPNVERIEIAITEKSGDQRHFLLKI